MKQTILALSVLFSLNSWSQTTPKVDFTTANASIRFDIAEHMVIGDVTYQFTVNEATDTIKIDAKNMMIQGMKLNGQTPKYHYDKKKIALTQGYTVGENTLTISYKTNPKQALYYVGSGTDLQIWTQGQGKYTSHWLPSFDDYNEKVIFNTKVTFETGYDVISNGVLDGKTVSGKQTTWSYKMNHPMSSYLMMMAIGKFDKKTEKAASGITIENYIRPVDASKYATTYQHTKKMFDFLEKQTGFSYPWQIYRNIPVQDFMYGGMENTTSTIFNSDYVVDNIGVNDRDFVNVNAHEMAHQWFGNVVTAKTNQDHWLQEGFATYYALLAERELYGVDDFYWKLYEMAELITKDAKENKNTAVYSEKATTTTYYQKGAWMLFYLSSQIGEANFNTVVKNYLHKYAFKNASTQDFLNEVVAVAPNFNLDNYKRNWLENKGFNTKEALFLIQNSPKVKSYFEVLALQEKGFEVKKEQLLKLLKDPNTFTNVKREIVFQLHGVPYNDAKEFYQTVMASNDLKVRQALAQIISEIPAEFLDDYTKLLNDESYITREIVLKNLWLQNQAGRAELLDKTATWKGFNDYNLRITWLMFALATENYKNDKKAHWYSELENFAYNKYNSNIRTNAINALWYLNQYDSNTLPHLVNALVHHNSRFQKFGRDAIVRLCEKKEFKDHFIKLIPYLPQDEHEALKKLMDSL
ncbi:M1 family metallopeptidase [Flavobacterium sp. CBA20B-1]|uniref:M1 family metallopeptidase n=1 Tax=unclassified Flavobacterium TaxID=196869 RepID=UPI002224E2D5|nr:MULTISPECIES: M1 family metallopeptidase [unclassified Flavobacterium]WCM42148.1 M1 family metallopeptidase [Flavobacterium sp. CBA20B-1]